MNPWHYIVKDGKLAQVSEDEAKAHLQSRKVPEALPYIVVESAETMPLKASQALVNVRPAKQEEAARAILETRLQTLIDWIEEGKVPGLLHIVAVRVDFCAAVRIHYWYVLGSPKIAPAGRRYHNDMLLKEGSWQPFTCDAEKHVCDIRTADGRTYPELWPNAGYFNSLIEDGLQIDGVEVSAIRYLLMEDEV